MKPRTVTILWIIAILLGVSVFFLKQSESGSGENKTDRAAGETLLPDFPAGETEKISIKGAGESVTLVKKESGWAVSERDDFPANVRNINDLLRSVAEVKVTQGIEAGPSFAPRFGMDADSSDPEKHGVTVIFGNASDKDLAVVSFGKNLEANTSSPFGGGSTGRYVRNHRDKSGIYAVSEVFGTLSPDPKSWLADDFIKLDKIKSISLTKPGSDKEEYILVRDDESSDFKFTDAFPGVTADNAATSPLKSLFSYARFDDVVPADKVAELASPEQLQKAQIITFEGFTYDISLQPEKSEAPKEGEEAPASAEQYLMGIKVSAELPKERKKAEDETPEQAEAADKAFAERLATLTERLEKTKELEGRTFVVSKFTVDALLKGRAELMSKGPGPGAEVPAPPPGTAAFTPPVEIPLRPIPTAPTEESDPGE